MGLDVLSVRCFRHNTSHSAASGCPLCERDADEARARAAELEHEPKRRVKLAVGVALARLEEERAGAEQVEREHAAAVEMCKGCAAAAALPPVLLPPCELEPQQHVQFAQFALSRLKPSELLALLGELELWKLARQAKLHRYPIHGICIAPAVTTVLPLQVLEAVRLVRLDIACDEGERLLELVTVGALNVGTRRIGDGGTLAQLNRCPLARETLTPAVGGTLAVTNGSSQRVTLRGVVIVEVLDRSLVRTHHAQAVHYASELEPWERELFERFDRP